MFLQARSRSIIKYRFIAQLRIKEGRLPGVFMDHSPSYLNKISLAVDEKGLWAVYVGTPNTGFIDISRVNTNTLEIEVRLSKTFLKLLPCCDWVVEK